jgi:hypothetical protein
MVAMNIERIARDLETVTAQMPSAWTADAWELTVLFDRFLELKAELERAHRNLRVLA